MNLNRRSMMKMCLGAAIWCLSPRLDPIPGVRAARTRCELERLKIELIEAHVRNLERAFMGQLIYNPETCRLEDLEDGRSTHTKGEGSHARARVALTPRSQPR